MITARAAPIAEEKKAAVATVDQISILLSLLVVDAEGRNRYGGHVFHISGARRLTAMDTAEPTV